MIGVRDQTSKIDAQLGVFMGLVFLSICRVF